MSARRGVGKPDEEPERVVEWPGRQKPTTQLTLFETTFRRRVPLSPPVDPEPQPPELDKGQLTLDRFLTRRDG